MEFALVLQRTDDIEAEVSDELPCPWVFTR